MRSMGVSSKGTGAEPVTAGRSSRFAPLGFAFPDRAVAEEAASIASRGVNRTESRVPFLPFLPLNAFSSSSSRALHSSSAIAPRNGAATSAPRSETRAVARRGVR